MAVYGPNMGTVGSDNDARRSPAAVGAHKFHDENYYHVGSSGDVRGYYIDLYCNGAGAGETLRLRGIVNGTNVATGGTLNALHATGRVAAGKTVSGAMNAIRATLEVAGTTPTPGGTLSALQLDSNIVTGATMGANDAFIRVSDSGATKLTNLLSLAAPGAKNSGDMFVARHADCAATHAIKIVANGTNYYIMVSTDTPAD